MNYFLFGQGPKVSMKKSYHSDVRRQELTNFDPFQVRLESWQQVLDVEHVTLHWPKVFDHSFDVFFDVKSFPGSPVIRNIVWRKIFFAASHPINLKIYNEYNHRIPFNHLKWKKNCEMFLKPKKSSDKVFHFCKFYYCIFFRKSSVEDNEEMTHLKKLKFLFSMVLKMCTLVLQLTIIFITSWTLQNYWKLHKNLTVDIFYQENFY